MGADSAPCSALCDPAEGLHRVLSWGNVRAAHLQQYVGKQTSLNHDGACSYCDTPLEVACIPPGTEGTIEAIDDAYEAPPSPCSCTDIPYATLATIRVVRTP
jgi:hypothetical protein